MRRFCLSLCFAAALAAPAPAQDQGPKAAAKAIGNAFAGVYERVAPAVVVLEVVRGAGEDGAWEPLFGNRGGSPYVEQAEGSGFIVRADGYILTNAHVIEGADPRKGVVARRQDGTRLPVTVVGVDDKTDLAVLKADAGTLPAVEWADSDAARVGEFVCSIGAPFDLDYTLTAGIISAKGRSNLGGAVYEDYLQTDAAINPGNSGGPLCDLDGRVLGVNTLINGISRGLGFAIPSKIAKSVCDDLIRLGRVVRPWLGIRIETLGDDPGLQRMMGLERGVLVRTVEPDAPASRGGLKPTDVIVELDGQPVASARELQQAVLRKSIGQEVELKVWRRGPRESVYRTVKVTTEELPSRTTALNAAREDLPQGGVSPLDGLQVQDLAPPLASALGIDAGGAIVTRVEKGSAAALAGLRPRDVITAVGDKPVQDAASFSAALSGIGEGETAVLMIERGGKKTYALLKK